MATKRDIEKYAARLAARKQGTEPPLEQTQEQIPAELEALRADRRRAERRLEAAQDDLLSDERMDQLYQQVVRMGEMAANPDRITEEDRGQMLASVREQNARIEKVLGLAKELHPEQFSQTPEEEAEWEAEAERHSQEMRKWLDEQAEKARRQKEADEKMRLRWEQEKQRRAALGWWGRWREDAAFKRQWKTIKQYALGILELAALSHSIIGVINAYYFMILYRGDTCGGDLHGFV